VQIGVLRVSSGTPYSQYVAEQISADWPAGFLGILVQSRREWNDEMRRRTEKKKAAGGQLFYLRHRLFFKHISHNSYSMWPHNQHLLSCFSHRKLARTARPLYEKQTWGKSKPYHAVNKFVRFILDLI